MVLQTTLLWIGTFAMLATGAFTLLRLDSETKVLTSFVSMLAWAIFGFGAFDVQTSGCCAASDSVSLGFFGLGLAAVMGVMFIRSWFKLGSEEMEGFG